MDEAESLASYALSVEPSSGHAVHARAHVFYETGQHAAGLAWLDEWIRTRGPEANHRSHFSWHAALHELMQCDIEAVQRRYERELAPPLVTGSRALVDSGALLWRLHVTDTWEGDLPATAVRDSAPDGWLITPPTAFAALHSALTLAAASDPVGLAALRTTSLAHADPSFRDVVAPVCCALQSVVEGEFGSAATQLAESFPGRPHSAGAPRSATSSRTRSSTRSLVPVRASRQPQSSTSGSADGRHRSTPGSGPGSRAGSSRARRVSGKTGVLLREQRHQHPLGHQVGERSPGPVCQTGDDHEGPLLHALDCCLRHVCRRDPHEPGQRVLLLLLGEPGGLPKPVLTGPGQSTVTVTPVRLSSSEMLRE